jgi:uncharacterized protein (TIGR03437 family)
MLFLLIAFLFASTLHSATLETTPMPSFFFYEENAGQASPDVRLLLRGGPHRVYFSAAAIHLFNSQLGAEAAVRFAADGTGPGIEPLEAWPGVVNRFEGGAESWRRNIPAHRRVQFTGVYPGIDLVVGESGEQPSFTYIVQPGTDPATVLLDCGQARGSLNEQGDWLVEVSFGGWRFNKPRAYQESEAGKTNVEASYIVLSTSQVRLQAGSFDASQPLMVEVHLASGQPGQLNPNSPVIDSAGNIYFAGSVASSETCSITPGGTINFCPDTFVAGIDSQNRPLFFTVLAGVAEDFARHLAMDGEGNLVIAGSSASSDFPVTGDAFQPVNAGPIGPRPRTLPAYYGDLFFARLDTQGDLLYSTFYGGPGGEAPTGMAAGPDADIVVLASVENGFPTTAGAWFRDSASFCATCSFAAIVRFDMAGSRPLFSTLVPGSIESIAAHSDASVYAAGSAREEVPTTAGALQTELRGTSDAYLLRLATDGSQPLFATYLGGSGFEAIDAMVVAGNGDAWVYGRSDSPELVPNAVSTSFLSRISADGARLLNSEFFSEDSAAHLLRDAAGNILIYSDVRSPGLPVTPAALLGAGCGNIDGHAFLRRFRADGSLEFASYLPGSVTFEQAVTLDPEGAFHRVSPGRIERLLSDEPSVFALGCVTSAASRWNFSRVSPGTIITLIGTKMGPETGVAASPSDNRYPTELAGVRVWINAIAAPLLYVQAGQINAVTPFGVTLAATADVVVEYQGVEAAALNVDVVPYDFALFSLDGSGRGQAAAFNQDGSLNSIDNPAPRGSIVVLYGTGGGITLPPSADGDLAPLADFPQPAASIDVLFNRAFTETLYAGPAPGLVNGVVQINMRLPQDLPAEPAEILINVVVGGSQYVSPATIAIR